MVLRELNDLRVKLEVSRFWKATDLYGKEVVREQGVPVAGRRQPGALTRSLLQSLLGVPGGVTRCTFPRRWPPEDSRSRLPFHWRLPVYPQRMRPATGGEASAKSKVSPQCRQRPREPLSLARACASPGSNAPLARWCTLCQIATHGIHCPRLPRLELVAFTVWPE
ncbi:unnamed protein product [Rangifer tarandus platyrhynchus]|uniref:Uncharacterized protein n=2 Tax=Rangifer tarandus platyrhynchus TaxID=3082113 RepID=A0ACB0DX52_RANTA|nr:unnamed protein product [Rangifer tarandus platyrhynchus]CAI9692882.1 unnamed protein product [Rangifer tarandus platyrhynchus]